MDYKQEILSLLKEVQREGINNLIEFLESSDYFTAPASKNGHNNIEMGLCIHSYNVFKILEKKVELFKFNIPRESLIIAGLLHDLCKVNFYIKGFKNVKDGKKINQYGKEVDNWIEKEVWEIEDKTPLGHASKSIILIQKFIELTEWELYAIMWHMGIPESYEDRQSFNKTMEICPSALLLHTSDFESSVLFEKTIK